MTLYAIPSVGMVVPPPPLHALAAPPPLPAALPPAQDTYVPSTLPPIVDLGPPIWQDRLLQTLPLITLPAPLANNAAASLQQRIVNSGGQIMHWLQAGAGSLYSDAMTFFTGRDQTPPNWLNPAHYPSSNPLRQNVLSIGRQYIGVPYVWGGETPSGFDCSGLMKFVYAKAGIALPRTAAAQSRVGIPVFSKADLQPGDAIFLRGTHGPDPNAITHVGMYIGNGQVLAAPHTGARVRIESINEGLWASSKYAGARRYIV